MTEYIFYGYICVISVLAVIITAADKLKAKKNKWRISESCLLVVAALGGSAAMFITMQIIRHKTKHIKFMLGIPIIILFQTIVAVYVATRLI